MQQRPASGAVAAPNEPKYTVRGGVVVPLYVIVLALFGSAVSMTRRVPEYQRRALDSQDPLTNVEAREYLVFQIMQVLSAPLIAITAYYIIKPDTMMTSVVLGFGSGFASEPILLMIRSLVEKLSPGKGPAPKPEPSSVTVRVSPASTDLGLKQTQQFTSQVSGSTNQEVIWRTDPADASAGTISQSGLYSAPAAIQSEKTVAIIASSTADRSKSGSATVKLIPIAVAVSPRPPNSLNVGQTQQFNAQISGLPKSQVTWKIDPANAGEINQETGSFKPTTAMEKVTITATSKEDPTKSDSVSAKIV
jgi:hypothetical protein